MRLITGLCILLLTSVAFSADKKVYKSQDANGNVVYSDQGPEDAEEIEVPDSVNYTTTKKTYALPSTSEPEQPELSTAYTEFMITSPITDTAVRSNPGDLQISFKLDPALQSNHSIELLVDGSLTKTQKSAAPIQLSNLDRGTHSFQLQIVEDESSEVLQSSNSVSVTLLRHSILLRRSN